MASQKQGKGLNAKHTFQGKHDNCLLFFSTTQTSEEPVQDHLVDAAVCFCGPVLKELTMKVLNSMSSFIPLPAIIQRILQVCPPSLMFSSHCHDCDH